MPNCQNLLQLPVELAAGNNLSAQSEQGACLGDIIVFTCTVTGAGILEWTLDSTSVAFISTQGLNHLEYLPDVVVSLINVERDTMNPLLGNLTSELTVVVSYLVLMSIQSLQLQTAPNINELKYSLINNNECLIMNMLIKN